MKFSSVALSASFLALTTSAAIVPYHSTVTMNSGSTHEDRHDRYPRDSKASSVKNEPVSKSVTMKPSKKEIRRSRIRSIMYLDSDRHNHGHDVVVESYSGRHGHNVVEMTGHHHGIAYIGRHNHKRSTHYEYLPYGSPVVTMVRGSRHSPAVVMAPTMMVKASKYVPGRTHVIHENIHYRRRNQQSSSNSGSSKRFSIKHGKPGKHSEQGDKPGDDSGKHREQQNSNRSSDPESMHGQQGHKKQSGKSKHLSERSMSTEPSVTQSGVPGFVEVATPVFKSSLAKTVSGLAYSTNNSPNGTGFDLGTSDDQSTQFFMSPMNGTDGQVVYQLRVPILDSNTFKTVDHCATFAISPPGPLSLQNCGPVPGCSQVFSYDAASGQLQPIYGVDQMQPVGSPISTIRNSTLPLPSGKPAIGTLRETNTTAFRNGTFGSVANSTTASNDTSSSNSTSSQDPTAVQATGNMSLSNGNSSTIPQSGGRPDNATTTPQSFLAVPSNTSNSSAPGSAPAPSSGSTPASVALYFIPAEGLYQKPATIEQMLNSTSAAAPSSPAGNVRNVVASSDDGDDDDEDDDDSDDDSDNDSDNDSDDDSDDDSENVLNRAVIDPVTNASGAAGAPVPTAPQNYSGVNTKQVLGDGRDAGSDASETQRELKSDEAEDTAVITSSNQ